MPKELRGYQKLPGSARRYRTPTGDTISRRDYENRRFKAAGWRSWADYQRTAADPEYQRFARTYSAKQRGGGDWYRKRGGISKFGKYAGKQPTRGTLAPDSEFNEAYLAAKRQGFSTRKGGAFDKFLQLLGLRDPEADYQVGDTP